MSAQRLIYGRRQSHRLRPGRKQLMEEKLPTWQIHVPDEGVLDPSSLFPSSLDRLWLEVGFGGGEHLAAQAEGHPDVGLIGCEPYVNGVARLLALASERDNIRVAIDDARLLLRALPDGCLERIFVLFPDPWPKLRHQKRRIVNKTTVQDFARLLRPDGELRLATDDPGYGRAMLATVLGEPRLAWLAKRADDWRQRSADWPATRYEQKALDAGRKPAFLRFQRLKD